MCLHVCHTHTYTHSHAAAKEDSEGEREGRVKGEEEYVDKEQATPWQHLSNALETL